MTIALPDRAQGDGKTGITPSSGYELDPFEAVDGAAAASHHVIWGFPKGRGNRGILGHLEQQSVHPLNA
jgi:hypothetical protein